MAEPTRCRACVAGARSLFSCLSRDQLSRLTSSRLPHAYARGQPIFYEGNPAFAVYCIRSGKMKLFRRGHNGDEFTVGRREAGDLMGVRAVLCGLPYAVTAEALEASVVCTIPGDTFLGLVRENSALALALLTRVSAESRTAEDLLVARSVERVSQRTARFLLGLAQSDRAESGPGLRFAVGMSRGDMARWIGTAPETLSRTLHDFAAQGILELGSKEIVVRDPASLRRLAERGDLPRPPRPGHGRLSLPGGGRR